MLIVEAIESGVVGWGGSSLTSCARFIVARTFDLLFEIIGERLPQMRMRLDQPSYIAKIFDSFALPSLVIAPSRDLAFKGVFQ